MYKNYIFDLYGTIIDIETNENRAEFWHRMAVFYSYNGAFYSAKELKKSYNDEVKKRQRQNTITKYPDIKLQGVFRKLYEDKDIAVSEEIVTLTARLFRNLSTRRIAVYDGVIEILESLKSQGKKIYLLSNGQREFTVPELKYFGLYDYFDKICCSSDVQVCKPDGKFYYYLIDSENLKIDESIMIGNDHTSDIAGANNIGMDSLYIHSNCSWKINVDNVNSTYKIVDGDFRKVKGMII